MGEEHYSYVKDDQAGPGPVLLSLTGLSALIIAAVAWISVAGAFHRSGMSDAGRSSAAQTAPVERRLPVRPARTVIYLVGNDAEAARFRQALEEWDQAIRDSGLQLEALRRVVLSQAPEDVVAGRAFDFSFITGASSDGDVRIVDLRN